MAELSLAGSLSLEIYCTLLVFVRISAAFLLLPGFGEPAVPTRMRFLAALAAAAAVAPAVAGMPAAVPDTLRIGIAIIAEAMCGALLGILTRTVISGVLVAGQIISQSVGLTNIFAPGLSIDAASAIGGAIYAGVVAILFASNGHHVILRALVESYDLLPPARFPEIAASLRSVVSAGVRSLRLGGQLSLPFLLLALVFNVALAAINRAMPSMPVFMIANPALTIFGLYLLVATIPGILDIGMGGWSDLASLLR
jgi:flagellar biosynthesis protein FliR